MADMLKPGMLDSIDTETLKPSTDMAAASYCATVIANLEGWRGANPPTTREGRRATIERLDVRIRRLEERDGINPPPPMDTPSWDSLLWRVARLHRKMVQPPMAGNRLPASPPHIKPTMALLRSTAASLGGAAAARSWPAHVKKEDGEQPFGAKDENEYDDDDEYIEATAQFLAYLAGSLGYKIIGSFELPQNCKLALDLSLELDATNSGFPVGPAMPPVLHSRPVPYPGAGTRMGPPLPRVPPPHVRKACCGCCVCACHSKDAPKPGVLKWMTGKYAEEKQARRTGFKARIGAAFRKLAFWRRSRGDDSDSDASSITTRTSSTLD